ncbi:MAG: HlyC/CorC family transporter [Candidatus Methanoperedens sp.]|nr:HlyC/CorC family transporter [Candidatus Methanoperedens sp.]MCE8427699.1 HlyC/CorC family transporter [Candidatus Methanoperedens sp.]
MDSWITIEIITISILIVFSAFFSLSETALLSVNKIRIRHQAETGIKNAKVLVKLLENPELFLAAILIGNNIVNITASVLATDAALEYFGESGIAIATGVMTLFILVFGEVFPKTVASRNAEYIALRIANPITTVIKILRPVVWFITTIVNFMIVLFRGKERVKHPFVTEELIQMMLKVGEKEGTIEKHEREIISNVFDFTDEKAHGVMTPREDIVSIEQSKTLDEALLLINESGHSRLPVYEKNFDNIIGMIYAKDLLKYRDHELSRIKVFQILRPLAIVKAGKEISSILKELQQKKMNISVVVDNNMKVIGLVSIEDILEELVGEIFDEYDVDDAWDKK